MAQRFFLIAVFLLLYSSLFSQDFYKVCSRPEVYVCDQFLSEAECDHIISVSKKFLARSTVVDPKHGGDKIDSVRTSLGMFIPSSLKDKIIRNLESRIAQITKLPKENGENFQVLYYGAGAEYRPHYDYFDPSTESGLVHYKRGGQRVISFLIYLNTPEEGGETIFPKAHVKIAPQKGKALFFYNVTPDGKMDPKSLHGGSPVIRGEKWLMTKWIRERTFY
jgi:prolyl 4-hydroxylase